MRGCRVTVPASSANLGPGFDSFAAALSLHFELTVTEASKFQIVTDLDVPKTRRNLCVKAFEALLPAANYQFTVRSEIPLIGGLGSSAAGTLAGLAAANCLAGVNEDILPMATHFEGHPDNAVAALRGGFVVCGPDGAIAGFEPPAGLDALLVIPYAGVVRTQTARSLLPKQVPLADAAANCARAALLALGLRTADFDLIAAGLPDCLHQPYRARLYPQSYEIVESARNFGALGATISGAGPTVLVWSNYEQTPSVIKQLRTMVGDWAEVRHVNFETRGLMVEPLDI